MIDSGPLIATLHRQDRYHLQAIAGFRKFQAEQWILALPLPIVFEVHRWLMQQQGPRIAQTVLKDIDRSFEIYYIEPKDYQVIKTLTQGISNWQGSLADAAVIHVARKLKCPIWTLDYRDLGIFKAIEFWNP